MSVHRYARSSLYADYARAGIGLILTVTPLLVLDLSHWIAIPLGACAILFLAFGAKTILRHLSFIETTDDSISLQGPVSRSMRWSELNGMRLNYYATRRERGAGWMQLSLQAGGKRIGAESTLTGFDEIARLAAAAASRNAVPLDERTRNNLEALGITFDAPGLLDPESDPR